MTKPKTHFRYHLSTLLTLILVFGMLMYASFVFGRLVVEGKGTRVEYYGFPFSAVAYDYRYGRTRATSNKPERYIGSRILLRGLLGDLLVHCCVLGWVYWLGEIRRERHTRRSPYRRTAGATTRRQSAPVASSQQPAASSQ